MDSCAGLAEARGCPIRIFTDQSLFAAPHDFSQRTTSFIASQCQGIHQMLLSRLMLSLSMAMPGIRGQGSAIKKITGARRHHPTPPRQKERPNHRSKKDLYVLDSPVMARSSSHGPLNFPPLGRTSRGQYKQIPSFTMSISTNARASQRAKLVFEVIRGQGSGIRTDFPITDYRLLITEPGGARRDRTDDLKLAKLALSQLSYGPSGISGQSSAIKMFSRSPIPDYRYLNMVGLGRFELPTSRLSSARSNQLSYRPLGGRRSGIGDQKSRIGSNPPAPKHKAKAPLVHATSRERET